MKRIFRKKNILLFFLVYGILTVAVSLFHLISGKEADPLGYWHEIWRLFFVLILLLFYDFVRNLSFRKNWKSFLEDLLPLLLTLACFVLLLYLKGDISFSKIRSFLLCFLAAVIGFLLLRAIFNALRSWFRNLFSGKKKIYFSFMSLLLLAILLIPLLVYLLISHNGNLFSFLKGNFWYSAAFLLFILILIGLFLSQNKTDEMDPLTIILILVYYVVWFTIGYSGISPVRIFLMQLCGCGILLAYENHNEFHHCIALTMLAAILFTVAALWK